MYIPLECELQSLFKRADISTKDSFKSWDTCMDNKTCKTVAIVTIVVGALFNAWMIAAFLYSRCHKEQSCLGAMFCCCLFNNNKPQDTEMQQTAYGNPNMYPPPQYGQPQQLQYDNYQQGRSNEFRYEPGVVYDDYDNNRVQQHETTKRTII